MMPDADGFGPDDLAGLTGVSRETLERIGAVLDLLREWSDRMNLVGARELDRLWRRHVWDALELVRHIPPKARVVDMGSGSGFPALVIAAWQGAEAGGEICMIESVGKKCRFLESAGALTCGVFHVKHSRIEALAPAPVDVLTARALAPLPDLLGYAAPWLKTGGYALFPKGERVADELTAAREKWTFEAEELPNRASDGGVILKVSAVSARRSRTGNHS